MRVYVLGLQEQVDVVRRFQWAEQSRARLRKLQFWQFCPVSKSRFRVAISMSVSVPPGYSLYMAADFNTSEGVLAVVLLQK